MILGKTLIGSEKEYPSIIAAAINGQPFRKSVDGGNT
jgi:hypothetical protein